MTMAQSKLQTEKLEGDMRQLLTEKQNEVTNMQKQLDSARNLEKNIDDLKCEIEKLKLKCQKYRKVPVTRRFYTVMYVREPVPGAH